MVIWMKWVYQLGFNKQQRRIYELDGFMMICERFWLVYFTKFTTCFMIDAMMVRVYVRRVKIKPI